MTLTDSTQAKALAFKLNTEADASEELDASDSSVQVMREAARAVLALSDALAAARAEVKTLREALNGMLFHFDKPKRDEWLTKQAWQAAFDACDNARVLASTAAEGDG